MNAPASEETLLWKGTPSQWINLGTYLLCLLAAAAVVAAWHFWSLPPAVLAALALPALFALGRWWETRSRVYELTTERIRVRSGVLARRTSELELYRVRDYTVYEPLLLRLVGRGDLVLETADRSTPHLVLHAVPGVAALKDEVRNQTERLRRERGVRDFEINPQ